MGNTVGFFWVPAHVGIQGTEEADGAAKRAINWREIDLEVLYGKIERKSLIHQGIAKLWQKEWRRETKADFILQYNQH